ncbi:Hypothetical predicted protein [Olea europaea subsp. europaea]|uniref:DUF1985 domain-containing protein n=1 Tax=Olea europaea subsp. europaea TaxID=158383 RepID=A0A8S0SYL3_OLEEU|nr:Hypothetical predicted protein [Olea europaea subsp. europaea]
MDFEPLVPKNARLRGHVSQRSNLRYIKTVVEHFDERQRADFRNSCLGFLSEVSDLQFSAQLIQQLVFYCIQTNKRHKLWFNLQGHLARISYGRLIKGFRGRWARKFLDTTKKKEKAVSYTVHDFPIAIQIWAFEAVPEIGDRFGQRLGERSPRLLGWTSTKQPQQRMYDAFFKNVQLHMYAMLCPTKIEHGQLHIATLALFNHHPVPALDDLARDSVAPQFQAERIGIPKEGTSENETSDEAHDGGGTNCKEEELGVDESGEAKGEDLEEHDSGDSDGDRVRRSGQTGTFSTPHMHRATSPMQASSTSHVRPTATAGSSLTTDDVQGMLLDQRILFEMWLRTVKLEIMQHVSDEFKKLKDFISSIRLYNHCIPDNQVLHHMRTTVLYDNVHFNPGHHPSHDGIDEDLGIDRQEGDGMCINEEHMESCLDEQDMPLPTGTESLQVEGGHHPSPGNRDEEQDMLPTGTKHLQDIVHIKPCPDNDLVLVLLGTDEVQVPANVARLGREVTTKRRQLARLRRPALVTRTPYTRGSAKQKQK